MIFEMYGAKDAARGDAATFLWLTEEFGELATALRSGSSEELALEMADVLAWLATLANIRGIDLESAVLRKYGNACPGCRTVPCVCDPAEKP
jgi:NTP pyrophosphatase (non-canonical NTP hydrolase)